MKIEPKRISKVMKAKRINETKIEFSGIVNDALSESVEVPAKLAKCKVEKKDFGTKVIVSGTKKQIEDFVSRYNEY